MNVFVMEKTQKEIWNESNTTTIEQQPEKGGSRDFEV